MRACALILLLDKMQPAVLYYLYIFLHYECFSVTPEPSPMIISRCLRMQPVEFLVSEHAITGLNPCTIRKGCGTIIIFSAMIVARSVKFTCRKIIECTSAILPVEPWKINYVFQPWNLQVCCLCQPRSDLAQKKARDHPSLLSPSKPYLKDQACKL